MQDPTTYCAASDDTVSGYPCIPGVLNVLGSGYDAISGSILNPVVRLEFSQGRTFTIQGQTYELPDGVTCSPISDTTSTFSTVSFRSTSDYRFHLSTRAGLSGNYNGVFLSASSEYTAALEQSFLQERTLFTSDLTHGLYECSIVDSLDLRLSDAAVRVSRDFTGDRRVQALGTHYITSASFGGRVNVLNYVQTCVFQSLNEQEVSLEVEASAFNLAGAPAASGGVEAYTSTGCSVYTRNAIFTKTVTGGDRTRLIVPGADSVEDLRQWFDSLEVEPGAIRQSLNPITYAFPEMSSDIEVFINKREVRELEVNIGENLPSCARSCQDDSASAASVQHGRDTSIAVLVVSALLVPVLIEF